MCRRMEQVLACMGPPAAKMADGHTEVWSYNSGDGHTTAALITSSTAVSTTRHCTVGIVMTDNRVIRLNYSGPTGGLLTTGEKCAFAIQNCVRSN
jgi:hypothetical protein